MNREDIRIKFDQVETRTLNRNFGTIGEFEKLEQRIGKMESQNKENIEIVKQQLETQSKENLEALEKMRLCLQKLEIQGKL